MKLLLAHKDINVNLQSKCGDTVLIRACINNYIEIVKLLLQCKDIDINLQNKEGYNALHYANEDIKKLLEEYNFKLINNNMMNVHITKEMINNKEFKINFIIN